MLASWNGTDSSSRELCKSRWGADEREGSEPSSENRKKPEKWMVDAGWRGDCGRGRRHGRTAGTGRMWPKSAEWIGGVWQSGMDKIRREGKVLATVEGWTICMESACFKANSSIISFFSNALDISFRMIGSTTVWMLEEEEWDDGRGLRGREVVAGGRVWREIWRGVLEDVGASEVQNQKKKRVDDQPVVVVVVEVVVVVVVGGGTFWVNTLNTSFFFSGFCDFLGFTVVNVARYGESIFVMSTTGGDGGDGREGLKWAAASNSSMSLSENKRVELMLSLRSIGPSIANNGLWLTTGRNLWVTVEFMFSNLCSISLKSRCGRVPGLKCMSHTELRDPIDSQRSYRRFQTSSNPLSSRFSVHSSHFHQLDLLFFKICQWTNQMFSDVDVVVLKIWIGDFSESTQTLTIQESRTTSIESSYPPQNFGIEGKEASKESKDDEELK